MNKQSSGLGPYKAKSILVIEEILFVLSSVIVVFLKKNSSRAFWYVIMLKTLFHIHTPKMFATK